MSYLSIPRNTTVCGTQELIDTADALETLADIQSEEGNKHFCIGAASALLMIAGRKLETPVDFINIIADEFGLALL